MDPDPKYTPLPQRPSHTVTKRRFWSRLFAPRETSMERQIADSVADKETQQAAPNRHDAMMGNGMKSLSDTLEAGYELGQDEQILIENVRDLSRLSALDVMIPRADVIGIDASATGDEVLALMAEKRLSRIPIYRDTIDDLVGVVYIKDVLVCLAGKKPLVLDDLVREIMIISPAMPALTLLSEMRESKSSVAFVVDEFGGIDGMITVADLVAAIIGEINDEHNLSQPPNIIRRADGTIIVDARAEIEDIEEKFGEFLTADERDDIDTIAGLVVALAGRVPARGEYFFHSSGARFEVLDADPRRVRRVRMRLADHVEKTSS